MRRWFSMLSMLAAWTVPLALLGVCDLAWGQIINLDQSEGHNFASQQLSAALGRAAVVSWQSMTCLAQKGFESAGTIAPADISDPFAATQGGNASLVGTVASAQAASVGGLNSTTSNLQSLGASSILPPRRRRARRAAVREILCRTGDGGARPSTPFTAPTLSGLPPSVLSAPLASSSAFVPATSTLMGPRMPTPSNASTPSGSSSPALIPLFPGPIIIGLGSPVSAFRPQTFDY